MTLRFCIFSHLVLRRRVKMEASVSRTIKLTLLNAFVREVLLENIATKVHVIYIKPGSLGKWIKLY